MDKYQLPKFLISEIAIKDKSYNDDRIWITCPQYLSIIEFVLLGNGGVYASNQIEMNFDYEGEEWIGFFAQNNCEMVDIDPKIVLKEAWEYFKNYLIWEDRNLDLRNNSILN